MSETFESPISLKKHGVLLTIWMILIIIVNIGSISGLFWSSAYPNTPSWLIYVYAISGSANVVFMIFLFMWKKWAFFAYCASVIVVFILNMIDLGVGSAGSPLFALAGPLILYWILHSRWNLLE